VTTVKEKNKTGKRAQHLEKKLRFRIIVEQDEDGFFVVECPTLSGCISQGKTLREARKNIKEAIEGYLESLQKHGEPIPPSVEEDVVEVEL